MTHDFEEVCNRLREEAANKAYVVTYQDYEDSYNVAVFLDRDEAEQFVNHHDDEYDIEEHIIGPPDRNVCIRRVWECDIDLETGEIGRQIDNPVVFNASDNATEVSLVGKNRNIARVKSSVSERHAEKVAIEKWHEHIRIKEGSYD